MGQESEVSGAEVGKGKALFGSVQRDKALGVVSGAIA